MFMGSSPSVESPAIALSANSFLCSFFLFFFLFLFEVTIGEAVLELHTPLSANAPRFVCLFSDGVNTKTETVQMEINTRAVVGSFLFYYGYYFFKSCTFKLKRPVPYTKKLTFSLSLFF